MTSIRFLRVTVLQQRKLPKRSGQQANDILIWYLTLSANTGYGQKSNHPQADLEYDYSKLDARARRKKIEEWYKSLSPEEKNDENLSKRFIRNSKLQDLPTYKVSVELREDLDPKLIYKSSTDGRIIVGMDVDKISTVSLSPENMIEGDESSKTTCCDISDFFQSFDFLSSLTWTRKW